MKSPHIVLAAFILVAGITSALLLMSSEDSDSGAFTSYELKSGMIIHYPVGMALLPEISSLADAGFEAVAMQNFTPSVPLSPWIDYLSGSQMYIQINEFDATRWEQIKAGKATYPEEVFFIDKAGIPDIERVQEKLVTVAGMPAVQRRVWFRGPRGPIDIWFTYFESNGKPFQARLLSGSSKGARVYETMLGMIELQR